MVCKRISFVLILPFRSYEFTVEIDDHCFTALSVPPTLPILMYYSEDNGRSSKKFIKFFFFLMKISNENVIFQTWRADGKYSKILDRRWQTLQFAYKSFHIFRCRPR